MAGASAPSLIVWSRAMQSSFNLDNSEAHDVMCCTQRDKETGKVLCAGYYERRGDDTTWSFVTWRSFDEGWNDEQRMAEVREMWRSCLR